MDGTKKGRHSDINVVNGNCVEWKLTKVYCGVKNSLWNTLTNSMQIFQHLFC